MTVPQTPTTFNIRQGRSRVLSTSRKEDDDDNNDWSSNDESYDRLNYLDSPIRPLTEEGKYQVIYGLRKCTNLDVKIASPLQKPLCRTPAASARRHKVARLFSNSVDGKLEQRSPMSQRGAQPKPRPRVAGRASWESGLQSQEYKSLIVVGAIIGEICISMVSFIN